jgi:hypothetical protein
MIVDVRTADCCYVIVNGKTVYIDDSTDEMIVDVWNNNSVEEEPEPNEHFVDHGDEDICMCGEPLDDCPDAYEHMTHGV